MSKGQQYVEHPLVVIIKKTLFTPTSPS